MMARLKLSLVAFDLCVPEAAASASLYALKFPSHSAGLFFIRALAAALPPLTFFKVCNCERTLLWHTLPNGLHIWSL